jgi:HEAT repeat protein
MNEDSIEALIQNVKNPGWSKQKAAAISKLGKDGSPNAVSTLVWVLKYDSYYDKTLTIEALGECGDPDTVPALLDVIEDSRYHWENYAAIKAIGEAGPTGIQTLEQLFESTTWTTDSTSFLDLRRKVAETLGTKGWTPATVRQEAILALIEKDWDALVQFGTLVIPYILRSHGSYNSTDEDNSLETLVKIGGIGIEELIEYVGDNDYRVSDAAAKALGRIGDPKAAASLCAAMHSYASSVKINALVELGVNGVPILLQFLQDESKSIRSGVTQALGKIGDLSASSSLIAQLDDKDKEVRYQSAEALGKLADKNAVPHLIEIAEEDEEREVREISFWALGVINDPRSTTFLTEMLDNRFLINSAAKSLGNKLRNRQWTPKNINEEFKYYLGTRQWDKIVKRGHPVSEHLLAWLDEPDEDIQYHAALCLAKLDNEKGFLTLQDKAERGNARSARALGELGDRRVVPLLIRIAERLIGRFEQQEDYTSRWDRFDQFPNFSRSDVDLGFEVAGSLAKFRDGMSIRLLVLLLKNHPDYHVRSYAAERLGGMWEEPTAINALQRALVEDEDRGVRISSEKALARLVKI